MPALGRHFDLGTVYDEIKDGINPGNKKLKRSGSLGSTS